MHLTRTQLDAVLNEARKDSLAMYALFLMTYNHGLRISEAVMLTMGSFDGGYVTVRRLKHSLMTTQPLTEAERLVIQPLLDHCTSPKDRLWFISRQAAANKFSRFCRRAGIPQHLAHPHVLRHSLAMHTIHTVGIENLRQYLGHVSIANTGIYLRVDDETAARSMKDLLR